MLTHAAVGLRLETEEYGIQSAAVHDDQGKSTVPVVSS